MEGQGPPEESLKPTSTRFRSRRVEKITDPQCISAELLCSRQNLDDKTLVSIVEWNLGKENLGLQRQALPVITPIGTALLFPRPYAAKDLLHVRLIVARLHFVWP